MNFLSSIMIHATWPFIVNEWIQSMIEGYEVSGTVEVCFSTLLIWNLHKYDKYNSGPVKFSRVVFTTITWHIDELLPRGVQKNYELELNFEPNLNHIIRTYFFFKQLNMLNWFLEQVIKLNQ